jgi:hypothetical protein
VIFTGNKKNIFNINRMKATLFLKKEINSLKQYIGNFIDLGPELNNIIYLNKESFEFML